MLTFVTRCASAPTLQSQRLDQRPPLVDDAMDPLAETAWASRVEEQGPVVAAVEPDAGPGGLRYPRNQNDLVPIVSTGQPGDGSCFALSRAGVRNEADNRHPRGCARTLIGIGAIAYGDDEIRRISGARQCESLLDSRSRTTEDDDGIRATGRVGGRPYEEDGRKHQEQSDEGVEDHKGFASPPMPRRPH